MLVYFRYIRHLLSEMDDLISLTEFMWLLEACYGDRWLEVGCPQHMQQKCWVQRVLERLERTLGKNDVMIVT